VILFTKVVRNTLMDGILPVNKESGTDKSSSFILNESSRSLNKCVTQSFISFLVVISADLYYDVSGNYTIFLDGFPLNTISYVSSSSFEHRRI
jgi:hypothetical protein